jgi:flagellar motor switch/type III secretory pathway protein FliN
MTTAPLVPKQIPVGPPEEMWEEAGWLPCLVSVDLPLRRFTVRTLLQLEPGAILESNLADGADLPVSVNSQLIGWGEFEIVGQGLAVRLTELA